MDKITGCLRQFLCFLPVSGHIRQPYSPNSWLLFPFYHHPQSRGITCLLDMKRSLFALSQARHKGHHVISQLFDWIYLPHSLLLTIAFSKRYCSLCPTLVRCSNLHGSAASLHLPVDTGASWDPSGLRGRRTSATWSWRLASRRGPQPDRMCSLLADTHRQKHTDRHTHTHKHTNTHTHTHTHKHTNTCGGGWGA